MDGWVTTTAGRLLAMIAVSAHVAVSRPAR